MANSPGNRQAFELDGFIPYRLNRASEAISRGFAKIYRDEFSMTRPEWRVLANLGQHGKLTARQICHLSTQHKTKVSRAVSSLEQRKWLRREQNPADRREEWLQLTPAGVKAYRLIAQRGMAHDEALLAQLGKRDAAALTQALDALDALLEQNAKKTGGA